MKLFNFKQYSINESSTLSKFGLDKNTISNIHNGERLSHDAEVEEVYHKDLKEYSTNDLFGVDSDGSLIKIQYGNVVNHVEGNRYFRIIKNGHERSVRFNRSRNKQKFNPNDLVENITSNWDKYNNIFRSELPDSSEKFDKYHELMEMVSDFFQGDPNRELDVINIMDEEMDGEIRIEEIILTCFEHFKSEYEDNKNWSVITDMSLDEASHKFLVFIKDNIEYIVDTIGF